MMNVLDEFKHNENVDCTVMKLDNNFTENVLESQEGSRARKIELRQFLLPFIQNTEKKKINHHNLVFNLFISLVLLHAWTVIYSTNFTSL